MKILMATMALDIGGAETHIVELTKELRRRGIHHLKAVFSPEQAHETRQLETPSPGRRSVPASVPWVPPAAGLMLAGAVVEDLIKEV